MPELTRLIAGSRIADRSDIRRLERKHRKLHIQERLATISEVTYERCPSPPKIVSDQTVPLPKRKPQPPPREFEADPDLLAFYIAKATPLPPDDVPFDTDSSSTPAFKLTDMPEMEGVGRYRVAKNASREHRIGVLRRALSDLTPAMIDYFASTGRIDAQLIRDAMSHPVSPNSPLLTRPNAPPQRPQRPSFVEYVNKSGSLVQHGFSDSSTSQSGSSDESIRVRNLKNSAYSMTSASSDGQSVLRRTSFDKVIDTMAEADATLRTVEEITTAPEITMSLQLQDSEIAVVSCDDLVPDPGPRQPSLLQQGLIDELRPSTLRGRPASRVGGALKRATGRSPRRANRQVRFRESPCRETTEVVAEDSEADSFESCTSTGA